MGSLTYIYTLTHALMKAFFLYLMAILYTAAGINHFVNPRFYMYIMPTWLPKPLALVYISGICEVLCALLLLPPSTRHIGAWLIIALLIAVYPANIQMAINYWQKGSPHLWVALVRLPLQFVLIWWAWLYTKS